MKRIFHEIRRRVRSSPLGILVCFLPAAATAQQTVPPAELPTYLCRYLESPIEIDSPTPDAAWDIAPVAHLVDVRDGANPEQETTVRALWSKEYLYVRFDCEDSDIWGTFTERDSLICREEVVEVFINPSGDEEVYYEFEVSPRNTVFDLLVLNPGDSSSMKLLKDWDCAGLRTVVNARGDLERGSTSDQGWQVIVAIPFSEMITAANRPPKAGDRWRWNLYRIDRSLEGNEHSAWSPTGAVDFHQPSRFGTLEFVR